MKDRRLLLFLSVLSILLITLVLVGCGGDETTTTAASETTTSASTPASSDTTASTEATSTTEAAVGDPNRVLNASVLINAIVVNFNPFANNPAWPTVNGIFEPMMVYNLLKGEMVPWLADSYEWSPDFLTLTLKLHPGVKWSDGQPFTAKDVLFTFNLLKNTPGLTGPALSALNGAVASFAAPDDSTVVFTMKAVNTMALYDIVNQGIVPEHIWKDVADPAKFPNDKPVGTGPFTELVDFAAQSYQLDKNPNYWQEGQPTYKGIRVTAYSGNDAQAAALVDGQLDWTGSVLPNIEEAVIAKNPDISYNPNPAALVTQMNLNLNTKPLDDVLVRKAMSMALNREQILQVAFNGKAYNVDVTGLSDVYKEWKVADPSSLGDWTTYNADKANQMLDEAGYKKGADGMRTLPDGTPINLKLTMVQGFTDWISAGEIMVQNWKDVGIAVETVMIDPGAFFGAVPMGDFEIALWFGYSSPTPYGQYMNMMGSATVAPPGAFTMVNFNRYGSPAADALLAEMASTDDKAKQIEACQKLQKVFADEWPVVPLWNGLDWGIFNNASFNNWPSPDNNYSLAFPQGAVTPEQLIPMLAITPK